MSITRREFMGLGAAFLLACSSDPTPPVTELPPLTDEQLAAISAAVAAYFDGQSMDDVLAIGVFAGEDPDLTVDATLDAILEAETTQDAVDALHLWVAADFDDEAMVPVRGWYLSETETQLCVLYAMDELGTLV